MKDIEKETELKVNKILEMSNNIDNLFIENKINVSTAIHIFIHQLSRIMALGFIGEEDLRDINKTIINFSKLRTNKMEKLKNG